jgi:hypothetical protein
MIFHETKLPGIFEIHFESKPGGRGSLGALGARAGCCRSSRRIAERDRPGGEALHEDKVQRP